MGVKQVGLVKQRGLTVAAVVLAAGSSRRLGRPKQLLAYRGSTLLGVTLDAVRALGLPRTIVTLGSAAPAVRESLDLEGLLVVEGVRHTDGCSSSIVAALEVVAENTDGILLFPGDQPHVSRVAVGAVLRVASRGCEIAVAEYNDGIGHPFWFSRSMFGSLAGLHGDKAVWKLLESGTYRTVHVPVDENVPLDVDTRQDYERLLAG